MSQEKEVGDMMRDSEGRRYKKITPPANKRTGGHSCLIITRLVKREKQGNHQKIHNNQIAGIKEVIEYLPTS